MKRKIYWYIMGIVLAAVILSFVLSTLFYYRKMELQLKQDVRYEAGYLKETIELLGISYFENSPTNTAELVSNRITLLTPDGNVFFDSVADPALMENHKDRQEIKDAIKNGISESFRTSATLSGKKYFYAVRLGDGNILRVSVSTSGVADLLYEIIPLMMLAIFFISVINQLLAEVQIKKIVKPINELNLSNPDNESVYEELSPLLQRIRKQNDLIHSQMVLLLEQKEEFRAITEHMQEGFLVINRNELVVSYNLSALRILGVNAKRQDLTGSHILRFNRDGEFYQAVEVALEGHHTECLLNIGERMYQMIVNPVKDHKGYNGAIVIIIDSTEIQKRESLRREFSANVSHELKTPLTSISGYAEMLKNGLVKEEDITRFSEHIYREARRMITLVEDIMQLSRLDESGDEVEKSAVNLYLVAERVVQRRFRDVQEKGISLKLTGKHILVFGVEYILDEMIDNLCNNAIKYNKDQGRIEIVVAEEDGCPVITVSDTGIGISEADQERVFERFYRADKSHSKKIGGTGLGLSIVKRGAIFHHAKIELESCLDQGTKIKIIFNQMKIS